MNAELQKKVEQLKNSFTVEGVPLIPCRFSKEEIEEMRKTNTSHPSHWSNLNKVWTDEEIGEQINTMINSNTFDDTVLADKIDELMKSLPLENLNIEKEIFKTNLYQLIGWDVLTPLNTEFWMRFGSAPFTLKHNSNPKLTQAHNLYGACGMDEIFGTKFEDNIHLTGISYNAINQFDNIWTDKKNKKDLKNTVHTSLFNSLDEIEENVVVKRIKEEAKKFYHDKTKVFEERVKVFTRHGEQENSIFEPSDRNLSKIFQMHNEGDNDRNSIIECESVIRWWIDELRYNRSKLDWTNHYHPKLKQTERNYEPTDAACERLFRYYMEKLFLEEVGSFEFDW
jgi:L-rhamnose mutarotase